jgi:chitodextrinase
MVWSVVMNVTFRRLAAVALLVMLSQGVVATAAHAVDVPAAPDEIELHANADTSITISWDAVPGATSYRLYRGTAAGAEGTTPIATITGGSYTDTGLSPTPTYFYQLSAVNSAGESARTDEDASKTPPPIGTGGNVAGVTLGAGKVYYAEDALLGGFDWFQTLTGWFPQVLGSSGSNSPGDRVVDMAYSDAGTMTFNNVSVPTAGLYSIDWRYAFQGGLFPGVNNRRMGLKVNGVVITDAQSFPVTGSFDVYQDSVLQVHLNAGVNSVQQFAVSDHGLSRVDQLIVTPATASSPTAPSHLTGVGGAASVALSWTGSTGATSYSVFRGSKNDGEVMTTPVGTVTGTTFTDTGLHNGTTYFYFVIANNAVGISPTSNEISVAAGAADTVAPSAPTNLAATGTTGTSTTLTWTASTDNVGVTGYDVLRNGATVATATGTSYVASGLSPSSTYTFQLKARDAAGNLSAGSNTITVTTSSSGATNIALGRPTTASSQENAGTSPDKATDGNAATRWSSAFADPQWIQVDLGAVRSVSQAVITWQTAYGKAFQIQISNDAATWTTLYTTTTSTGGTQTIPLAGTGRYVRVYGTQRATQYGYSIWELQIFG